MVRIAAVRINKTATFCSGAFWKNSNYTKYDDQRPSLHLWPGLHGGADHPPGQCGPRPACRRRPAGGGEPERGGGLRDPGTDEPAELPLGASEGGKHGEAEQVGSGKTRLVPS